MRAFTSTAGLRVALTAALAASALGAAAPARAYERFVSQVPNGGTRCTTCHQTAGGGGYGAPSERNSAALVSDVAEGYVTLEAARKIYNADI